MLPFEFHERLRDCPKRRNFRKGDQCKRENHLPRPTKKKNKGLQPKYLVYKGKMKGKRRRRARRSKELIGFRLPWTTRTYRAVVGLLAVSPSSSPGTAVRQGQEPILGTLLAPGHCQLPFCSLPSFHVPSIHPEEFAFAVSFYCSHRSVGVLCLSGMVLYLQ